MAKLRVAKTKGEDSLHLTVVYDGLVEELNVFGAILRLENYVLDVNDNDR
jgi:hypothetical protein